MFSPQIYYGSTILPIWGWWEVYITNALHERASFIITTNKSPKEWAETIGDEVITTALLDRLLYRCEIIKLSGESYFYRSHEHK